MRQWISALLLVAAAAFVLCAPMSATPIIAYDNSVTSASLQGYGGSLGLDFQVTGSVTVIGMGAFDNGLTSSLDGVLGGGVTVMFYQETESGWILVPGSQVTFTSDSIVTQINGDAFQSIAPLVLGPGQYSVVAWNSDNYNSSGASNLTSTLNGAGVINFDGSARYDAPTGVFPTTIDAGPVNRYDAGTFQFETTPEPTTLILLGAGIAAMAIAKARRRA